jgi:AGZA family xanthine/uracil permease-like MFS transporter
MTSMAAGLERSWLGQRFRFAENGTTLARDTVAGVTTFIVMSYIIFVNPGILTSVPGLEFDAVLTSTCIVAGVLTIVMGLYTNRAFAIAPGLGLNATVAFTLVAGEGLGFPEAMGIILLEGALITALVLVGWREAVMEAIPLELKKAIAIGIGLFIAFIGLDSSGLIVRAEAGAGPPVALIDFTSWPVAVAIFGIVVTIAMRAMGIRGTCSSGSSSRRSSRPSSTTRPTTACTRGRRGGAGGRTTSFRRPTSRSWETSASTRSRRRSSA